MPDQSTATRAAFERLCVVTAWAAGLAAEVNIQVHVTGVRPQPDGRDDQVLLFMMIFGLIFDALSRRQPRWIPVMIGAVLGGLLVTAWALTGHTSPPKAGLLLLGSTGVGALIGLRRKGERRAKVSK